jgi:hypothetical protein
MGTQPEARKFATFCLSFRRRALPEPEAPAPVVATHLDATSLVVTRPARAHSRRQFRGSAALREAVIAREVLGLPLALRPPRF